MSKLYDPDKVAQVCRMVLAGNMLTQTELSERTGIRREHLNAFLRRKINLLDSDMEKILKALDLQALAPKLSAPCDICLDQLLSQRGEQTN